MKHIELDNLIIDITYSSYLTEKNYKILAEIFNNTSEWDNMLVAYLFEPLGIIYNSDILDYKIQYNGTRVTSIIFEYVVHTDGKHDWTEFVDRLAVFKSELFQVIEEEITCEPDDVDINISMIEKTAIKL